MKKIHCPQGQAMLQKVLGEGFDADGPIWDEYIKRVALWHRLGGSGPLPQHCIIDMLRFLGVESPTSNKAEEKQIDWRHIRKGTAIVYDDGTEKQEGEFCGLGSMGALHITLGDSPYVHEVRRHQVSLAPEDHPDIDRKSLTDLGVEPRADMKKEAEAVVTTPPPKRKRKTSNAS